MREALLLRRARWGGREGEVRVSCFDIQPGTKSCRFVRNVIARIGWLSSTWRKRAETSRRVHERERERTENCSVLVFPTMSDDFFFFFSNYVGLDFKFTFTFAL